MPLQYPKRGGFLYSFKSVEVLEGAEIWNGLLSVKRVMKIDGRSLLHGNRRRAYGRPRGNAEAELEVKFVYEAYFDYVKNHPGILMEEFNPTIINEEGSRRDAIKIVGLTFENDDATQEGTDASEVTLSGMAIDVLISVEGGPFRSLIDGLQEGEEETNA
jgi:hypothetical protein